MKPEGKALHYFLGSNTPQGFVSRFDQLADPDDDWRLFIIKGGPGSGKSTMLKKIAAHLRGQGRDVEIIHCSSDVDSLDGVICPSLKISFADGTPPHAMLPKNNKSSRLTSPSRSARVRESMAQCSRPTERMCPS